MSKVSVMEDQLAAFLTFLQEERSYSENTTAAYRNDLSQFLTFLRRHAPQTATWNDVTPDLVSAYVQSLQERRYASSSVARKVAATKSFFHHLYAQGLVEADPTAPIDSPRVEKRLPTTLSSEDIERLLAAPRGRRSPKHLRDAALLALLYATGMRVTEAVSLTLDDLDLQAHELRSPGPDEAARRLPFDAETARHLKRYLESGRPSLLKDGQATALFLNHRGQQLTRQGLWLIIKAYAKEVALSQDVTPHTLRHSFAAHKLRSGSDLHQIQQLLGHANISTTQIYTQIEQAGADEEE